MKRDLFLVICLLLTLYLLQGITIGIAYAIPLLLQHYNATYSEQGLFSLVTWPFSFKLLWAPIVDSFYIRKFGRRKTWLIPIQLTIGIVLIVTSFYIEKLLRERHVTILTPIFFLVIFLMASQDICVDAWSLNLLNHISSETEEENYLGWQSTCNTVGQATGAFIGMSLLIMLESHDFCNKYIRRTLSLSPQSYGIIKFSSFLLFWGIVFILVTCSVALFRREEEEEEHEEDTTNDHFTIKETYLSVVKLYRKKYLWELTAILLTFSIGFAASSSMTNLKLIEIGVSKEFISFIGLPVILIQIIIPFSVTRCTTSRKPLNLFIYSYIPRLAMSLVVLLLIYCTPLFQDSAAKQKLHWYFYLILVLILSLNESLVTAMFVSRQAFFAQIADPRIGGTYLTLLNTLGNFSLSIFNSINLFVAGQVSKLLKKRNGEKTPVVDTYTIMVAACTLLGIVWFALTCRRMVRLQKIDVEKWHLGKRKKDDGVEDCESTKFTAVTQD